METDWQTWIALGVVALTATLFLRNTLRKRTGDCGCGSDTCSAPRPEFPRKP